MLSIQAWTPKEFKETDDYMRVSMNENVTLYMLKRPQEGVGRCTDVYFYGPDHYERALIYGFMSGGRLMSGGPPTGTYIRVPTGK